MINKFAEKDSTGKYTAIIGSYKITVVKVPEGYSVTTGQTKTEIVEENKLKHHIAKIAKTDKTTEATTESSTRSRTDRNARTADATDIAGLAIVMLISMVGAGWIIRRKKEDEE